MLPDWSVALVPTGQGRSRAADSRWNLSDKIGEHHHLECFFYNTANDTTLNLDAKFFFYRKRRNNECHGKNTTTIIIIVSIIIIIIISIIIIIVTIINA